MFDCTKGKQDIDILFISHFHEDHINGIAKLKELTNIKHVVIPLYNDNTRLLLLAALRPRNKGGNLEKLIESPETYFSGSHVICVKSIDKGIKQMSTPVNVEESEPIIDSGTLITMKSLSRMSLMWEYIPYNLFYDERLKCIVNTFQISESELNSRIGDKDFQNMLKSRTPIESINTNSLMVYSGLHETGINRSEGSHSPNGCFYTGDASFNNDIVGRISNHLGKRCYNILMIQIPHHGSGYSFHDTLFQLLKNESVYPIMFLSCGNYNRYGHPSPMVITNCSLFLDTRKCMPIIHHNNFFEEHSIRIVCEDRSSMLVLLFDINTFKITSK